MRRLLTFTASAIFLGIVLFISCKRELSCENCKVINKPPIANAGRDTTITLPKDSATLDGTTSTDPDGTITSYKWVKITGPVSSNIAKPDSSRTIVKGLTGGVYQFELTVTDNDGLSAKDTVRIMVDAPGNQPPVACAGADQTITLPANTVALDGSCSADPDNNITAYNWTKVSGPSSFNITNVTSVQIQVTALVQGVYQFELKVTDAGGLFSKDTMQVTVNLQLVDCGSGNRPIVRASLIPIGALSQKRAAQAVAAAGNKILFAGGSGSTRVDVFDFAANTWSTAELTSKNFISAVAAGNKIFFAGGSDGYGWRSKAVDIYDVTTNTWSLSQLSREADGLTAATVGDKVFFAGGNFGIYAVSTVDIYDLTANTWSTASLSTPRNFITAVSANNKVYFAGGDPWNAPTSSVIDIYDNNTGAWSTSTLQVPRGYHAAIAVNDILYFAGGASGSPSQSICSVETLNTNTAARTLMNLSSPASFYPDAGRSVVAKDNKLMFFRNDGTDKFDIYNTTLNTWSVGVLPFGIQGASIILANNTIYVAGGYINGVATDKVWKLEF